MTFERTRDAALIRSIITHPKIWPFVTDDNAPPVESFEPTLHESICYVLVRDEGQLIGMWCFTPTNSVTWEVHTYMLPGHGFHRARRAAREVAAWIFENTGCRRIWTQVPEWNRIALKFAKDAGMEEFGFHPASFLRSGKMVSVRLLGLSKPTEAARDASPQGATCPQPQSSPQLPAPSV